MQVPQDITALATDGLVQMYAHPEHHYDWRTRCALYQQMHTRYSHHGAEAHGWLAVITAELVLPIFTSAIADDPLPQHLLECARQVMRQAIPRDSATVLALLDEGYLGTGIDCVEWRDTIAYHAEYAGAATYKALLEANGAHDLLATTEQHVHGKTVQVFQLRAGMRPEDVTDYDIAHLAAFSDTASAAAIAYACHRDGLHLDPQRLEAFWEWWATNAIPEAWDRVEVV